MRRRLVWSALSWLTLTASGAELACDSTAEAILAAIGEGCFLNTDCESDLVCVFRRCHQQCNTTEDCPLDDRGDHLRCVVGDKPTNVCQLDDEGRCKGDATCPGTQICGVDQRCRDECATDRDCVSQQLCRQATCAERSEVLDDAGNIVGLSPPGAPCSYSSQCAPAGDIQPLCTKGRCEAPCYVERDCPRFFRCTTADDPSTPGSCALIGERGKMFCDPDLDSEDREAPCWCSGDPQDAPSKTQLCKDDGSGYEACPCDE